MTVSTAPQQFEAAPREPGQVIAWRPRDPLALADAGDFLINEPVPCSPQILTACPDVLPYCFDGRSGEVILVRTGDVAAARAAPFLYDHQYRHATHAYRASVPDVIAMAPQPEVDTLVVQSTGRCGSTLLLDALRRDPRCLTWSEPDVFTQLAMAPAPDAAVAAALRTTIAALLGWFSQGDASLHVLKLRSVGIQLAPILGAVPRVRQLFLYRGFRAFAESTLRVLDVDPETWSVDERRLRGWARLAPELAEFGGRAHEVRIEHMVAALWGSPVARYLATWQQASWLGCLRYEALVETPMSALQRLFAQLDLGGEVASASLQAFTSDSQAESSLSRARLGVRRGLDDALFGRMCEALTCMFDDLAPDIELPGALTA